LSIHSIEWQACGIVLGGQGDRFAAADAGLDRLCAMPPRAAVIE
jgi:hypothetical protein